MRTMVAWVPDWPALVRQAEHAEANRGGSTADAEALAVLDKGVVLACTLAARAQGVRRGMRRRDAQSRCPDLVVCDHRPEVDARTFEQVLTTLEELSPGVAPLRPGLCALSVPERYYGGEAEAAAVMAEHLVGLGVWDVRFGIADGVFVAELAARQAPAQDCLIVAPGGNADFLRELPVEVLEVPTPADATTPGLDLVTVLRRLGIRRVGEFAALPAADVVARFGAHGALLHRWAQGEEVRPISRRTPPPELVATVAFEPALERSEAVVFSARQSVESFVRGLDRAGLVCSTLRIEVDAEVAGEPRVSSRVWRHPRWFGSGDVLDRLRWQLSADPPGGPVVAVRCVPVEVEPLGDHAESLFGGGPDDQVERSVARVQALVGPEGVRTVGVQGGRAPADRRLSAPWGERPVVQRPVDRPWPGSVPAPAPATVFTEPAPAQVVGAEGLPVSVSGRGGLSGRPARFRAAADLAWQPVAAWAGPWPVDEHWWDEAAARRVARFQVVGVDGSAWLMVVENGRWWTEARYD
ncbi:DNA polymerase Y family protein [Aeromicrobium senzhongii]|uniref:DNA polymerase Y family protein n=1 Tax=Aeromicrobium senzhongii TaxID=2663859 RepID=A0ABX6SQ39_9ACTN|nr:DNA polymerase Y family protein [Aeromicrobium senzhongii]MTB89239.1 DNA polymerase Y family protein [Aeromicrobium senzhongii]QNL93499.1 DNA polymerase Y family protein [Aeromicrobium senzhongii]